MSDVATGAPEKAGSVRGDAVEHARRLAKSISPKDVPRIRRLTKEGVPEPRRVLVAARKAKLPVSIAAALVVEERSLLHGATLTEEFEKLSVLVRKLGVRPGVAAYRRGDDADAFADKVAERQRRLAPMMGEKPAKPAKVVLNPRNWWKRYVFGDTDCERPLLTALANVAKDLGVKIYIRDGRRTFAEQKALRELFESGRGPLAAMPNRNAPHIRGVAADCAVGTDRSGPNIGDFKGARDAMRRRGICLCVRGETWHVQRGDNWQA
jgi:hypothetical protein